MLKSLKRAVYTVKDLEAAKNWYSSVLDKKPLFDSPFTVIFQIGECSLSLRKDEKSVPGNQAGVDIYWEVDDTDEAVRLLTDAGATLESPVRDALSIRYARIRDPFGNILGITGPPADTSGKSVENSPSETALSVAFCRALSALDEREAIKGPDDLAHIFLKPEALELLKSRESRQWAVQQLVSSPLYGYFISRTAFVDQAFAKALSDGLTQIVLLGAGYDTRPLRFSKSLNAAQVFELDIQSTQHFKLDRLREQKIPIPQEISFVAVNFRKDDFGEVLIRKGYNPYIPSLFIWEGVTYYLAEESVRLSLQTLRKIAAPGSRLCCDFMGEKLASVNAAEPFLFWIQPSGIEAFLAAYGFETEDVLDAAEMKKKFLTLPDGSMAEEVLSQFYLINAILTVS